MPEAEDGLNQIVHNFQDKAQFMHAVKLSKKVKTKEESELREMLGLCVE